MQKKVSIEGLELICHLDTETWAISRLYKKVGFKAIYNVLALKNRTPRRNSFLMLYQEIWQMDIRHMANVHSQPNSIKTIQRRR